MEIPIQDKALGSPIEPVSPLIMPSAISPLCDRKRLEDDDIHDLREEVKRLKAELKLLKSSDDHSPRITFPATPAPHTLTTQTDLMSALLKSLIQQQSLPQQPPITIQKTSSYPLKPTDLPSFGGRSDED